MRISRKNLLLIIAACLLVILGLALLAERSRRHSPSYAQTVTSPDTGETASFMPNKSPETDSAGSQIVLFGSYLLLDNGATQGQFDNLRSALTKYAASNLHGNYRYLTLLPDSFHGAGKNIQAKIRLGDSNTTVDAKIMLWELKYSEIIIDGAPGGHYDSGQMTS